MGSFAADIAHLSRIVTLNNLDIRPVGANLVMDATAKTFRYLDQDEVAAQRKATKGGRKKR
jgi:type IV pilus assembly protein PilO